nr:gustatory receptor 16 [Aedes aegypti]
MNTLKVLCPSFNHICRFILLTFRCIGLIPFNVECINFELQFKCRRKQFCYKWILLTLSVCSAEILIALIFRERVFFTYYAVGLINDMLKYVGEIIAVYATLMEVFARRKDHIQIYDSLITSDLSNLNGNFHSASEYRQFFQQFSIKYSVYFGIILFIEFLVFFRISNTSQQWRNVWLINFPIVLFISMRVLYYIFSVDLVKSKLASVRIQVQNAYETMKWVKTYNSKSKEYKATIDKVSNSLIFLKQCYGEIWSIHFNLNNTSGWSICFVIISCFVQFSNHLYWLYLTFHEKTIDGYIETLLCLCECPLTIFIILYSTESCMEVSRNIGTLLHEIPKRSEKRLYHIIYRFSSHMTHQPIRFVSHSLFDINFKLIKMLLTGVATYMFIFIPFTADVPEVEEFITTAPKNYLLE